MARLSRTRHEFRSRQYRYSTADLGASVHEAPFHLEEGKIYRFILGLDQRPVELSTGQISETLNDPFAKRILQRGVTTARTLRALISQLDVLPVQRTFVVADGGQIPWSPETDKLNRQIRFVFVRSSSPAALPDLMISTSSNFDSLDTFLQVIGWDPVAGAHQFYDRREGSWVWAGCSWHAFDPAARGKGPFDSHVNGALNMKELKLPWINWHSQSAIIADQILAPEDPLRNEPFWIQRSPAQDLETTVVRAGIHRWTQARFDKCSEKGQLTHLQDFFRQVLETTTVNLVSSAREARTLSAGGLIDLPPTFFLNSEVFFDDLGIDADFDRLSVDSGVYAQVLEKYKVARLDETGKFRFDGDTHFVFVVPEPAFEDNVVVRGLISAGILTPKMAACLLMVDFCNPVFSRARASLLRYAPSSAAENTPDAFSATFVQNVQAASGGLTPTSAERQFLENWSTPESEWRTRFGERISAFIAGVADRLKDTSSFARIFELAESRRREFRRRPLAEFRLTTVTTNIPESAPLLEFASDGTVRNKPSED